MTVPTRTLLRFWLPCAAASFAPTLLAILRPELTASFLGWAALAAFAAAASSGAAWWLSRWLSADVERVSDDIEFASRRGFKEYARQADWGLLGDLTAAFDWMLQEVQGTLRGSEFTLTEERARLGALIHTIPDGILMANVRGEVLHVNAAAVEMLGLPKDEVREEGAGLYELIHHDRLRKSIERLLAKQARQDVVELETGSGGAASKRWFETTSTLFTNPEDQELGVMLLIRDVTAKRELERNKEEFFHAVAHDLRAPLFGIQGYVRMLEKSAKLEAKEKAYVASVYVSCERLQQLVADILDIARLDGERPGLEKTAVKVPDLLGRVARTLGAAAEEKGVRLAVSPEEGTVSADEKLLERAVQNLVANAIRFTPEGGIVTVDSRACDDGVEISVRDTGPGIPKNQLEAVFEKFRQLERGGAKSGFGLGLTIARQVVEAHGGRIWAESPPQGGARFAFKLPL